MHIIVSICSSSSCRRCVHTVECKLIIKTLHTSMSLWCVSVSFRHYILVCYCNHPGTLQSYGGVIPYINATTSVSTGTRVRICEGTNLGVMGALTLISGLFSSPSHTPLGKSSVHQNITRITAMYSFSNWCLYLIANELAVPACSLLQNNPQNHNLLF